MAIVDPNTCLAEIRELVQRLSSGPQETYQLERVTELVYELDSWIQSGGFLPSDWQPVADETLRESMQAEVDNRVDEAVNEAMEGLSSVQGTEIVE